MRTLAGLPEEVPDVQALFPSLGEPGKNTRRHQIELVEDQGEVE